MQNIFISMPYKYLQSTLRKYIQQSLACGSTTYCTCLQATSPITYGFDAFHECKVKGNTLKTQQQLYDPWMIMKQLHVITGETFYHKHRILEESIHWSMMRMNCSYGTSVCKPLYYFKLLFKPQFQNGNVMESLDWPMV